MICPLRLSCKNPHYIIFFLFLFIECSYFSLCILSFFLCNTFVIFLMLFYYHLERHKFCYFSNFSFNRALLSKHDRTVSRSKYHCAEINVVFSFVYATRAWRFFICISTKPRVQLRVCWKGLCRELCRLCSWDDFIRFTQFNLSR